MEQKEQPAQRQNQALWSAMGISGSAQAFVEDCEKKGERTLRQVEARTLHNSAKVLAALQAEQIAQRHFAPSTGYGYDDIGREALGRVFARALGAPDAIVRPQFASGTHAIMTALWGLLEPGQTLLSISGLPYDTIREAIGIEGDAAGSLARFGIHYREVALRDGQVDLEGVLQALAQDASVGLVYLQRSRGYAWREAVSIAEMADIFAAIRRQYPGLPIVVDNCYGEFVEEQEPTEVGADIIIGSLIKNPGGGLAPTGSYIAGQSALLERIAARMTTPGIGREVGSYAASYAPFYQGLFMAPHVVGEALKTAILASIIFETLGYQTLPASHAVRSDIIQAVAFGSKEPLLSFCQSIQAAAPVDSHVTPEPWAMPGYQDEVIMAAGAFVQGASIELSADGPVRPPYIAYMQGGLHYQHGKIALMKAVSAWERAGRVLPDHEKE